MSGPFWLDPLNVHFGGVDRLGLRQPGLTMADALLPGITNQTDTARYYSVVSWLLTHAQTAAHLRELEFAFVHATRKHGHVTGGNGSAVGIQSVPRGKGGQFPLKAEKRPPSVFDAASYGPSIRALGLGSRATGKKTRFAKKLADTLEIPADAVPRPGSAAVDGALVEKLGALCLCMSTMPDERRLLEELLFRHDEVRSEDIENRRDGPRRRSLALLLHALEPSTNPRSFLLQRFIDWHKGLGEYTPPKPLSEEAYGWAVLGTRWFFRHALETVWAGFGRMMMNHDVASTDIQPYVDRLLEVADGSTRWRPGRDANLADVNAGFGDEMEIELEGWSEIDSNLDGAPEVAILAAAVQLALIANRMPELAEDDRHYRVFPALGQPLYVSMSSFAQRATEQTTLGSWFGHLLARYAVGQHFFTATRKWAGGVDGFLFHPTARGYELARGVERWQPQAGPTKILAALGLLRGIKLVSLEGSKWSRTAAGDATIERVCARA